MSAKEKCVRENLLNHYFYDLSLELDMMVSEMVEKKNNGLDRDRLNVYKI